MKEIIIQNRKKAIDRLPESFDSELEVGESGSPTVSPSTKSFLNPRTWDARAEWVSELIEATLK